jgi:hypothetical protein
MKKGILREKITLKTFLRWKDAWENLKSLGQNERVEYILRLLNTK